MSWRPKSIEIISNDNLTMGKYCMSGFRALRKSIKGLVICHGGVCSGSSRISDICRKLECTLITCMQVHGKPALQDLKHHVSTIFREKLIWDPTLSKTPVGSSCKVPVAIGASQLISSAGASARPIMASACCSASSSSDVSSLALSAAIKSRTERRGAAGSTGSFGSSVDFARVCWIRCWSESKAFGP